MALKDWKKSKHHARPTTKIAWESKEGNVLAIDHIPTSNIPYKIRFNDRQVDSTGTLVRAMKIATYWKKKER